MPEGPKAITSPDYSCNLMYSMSLKGLTSSLFLRCDFPECPLRYQTAWWSGSSSLEKWGMGRGPLGLGSCLWFMIEIGRILNIHNENYINNTSYNQPGFGLFPRRWTWYILISMMHYSLKSSWCLNTTHNAQDEWGRRQKLRVVAWAAQRSYQVDLIGLNPNPSWFVLVPSLGVWDSKFLACFWSHPHVSRPLWNFDTEKPFSINLL